MDVPPPPAEAVIANIEIAFIGDVEDPRFRLINTSPSDAPIWVGRDGSIDVSDVNGWVVLVFKIDDTQNMRKVVFPSLSDYSFTYSSNVNRPKKPWDKGNQISKVRIPDNKSLEACYTNNKENGVSSYGFRYMVGLKQVDFDPRIKNSAYAISMLRKPCEFPSLAK